jgi:hypothetical protein
MLRTATAGNSGGRRHDNSQEKSNHEQKALPSWIIFCNIHANVVKPAFVNIVNALRCSGRNSRRDLNNSVSSVKIFVKKNSHELSGTDSSNDSKEKGATVSRIRENSFRSQQDFVQWKKMVARASQPETWPVAMTKNANKRATGCEPTFLWTRKEMTRNGQGTPHHVRRMQMIRDKCVMAHSPFPPFNWIRKNFKYQNFQNIFKKFSKFSTNFRKFSKNVHKFSKHLKNFQPIIKI